MPRTGLGDSELDGLAAGRSDSRKKGRGAREPGRVKPLLAYLGSEGLGSGCIHAGFCDLG